MFYLSNFLWKNTSIIWYKGLIDESFEQSWFEVTFLLVFLLKKGGGGGYDAYFTNMRWVSSC